MTRVLCVGHAVQDYVFHLPELPRQAEKHRAQDFYCVGGGPAATAAVTIARLGGGATLVARVGDDPIADVIRAELEGYGVDCRHLARMPGRRSSLSSVFIDDQGERLIINYTDPAMPADPTWVAALPIKDYAVVLADTRWPEASQTLLLKARESGLPAVLDADLPVPKSIEFLRSATHIAFSLVGLRDYLDRPEATGEQLLPDLQRLAAELQCWCALTLGAAGVAFTRGAEVTRSPAFAVRAVDTLGAGDVWHGAFALALAEGDAETEAVRLASATAALKVSRKGGRAGSPDRSERDRFLQGFA